MTTSLNKNKVAVVILAAGVGKRMKSELPKVMHLLNGRPLIDYVVSAVEKTDVKPVVVVSGKHSKVQYYLKDRATYAIQSNPLGTGHALAAALPVLKDVESTVVLYGDMPFVSSDTIAKLVEWQQKTGSVMTLATVTVSDFNGWRSALADFGRIVRDSEGNIKKIVEVKDAADAELTIHELNPAYFCFNCDWAELALSKIKNNNTQKEYYLTDLLSVAIKEGERITSINVDPREAVGINTAEGLLVAHSLNSEK